MVLQELSKEIPSLGWSIWIVMKKNSVSPLLFQDSRQGSHAFVPVISYPILFLPAAPIQQDQFSRNTYRTCNNPRCNLSLADNKTVPEMRVIIQKCRHFNAVHLRFPCDVINV